jgi:hypothetical protein
MHDTTIPIRDFEALVEQLCRASSDELSAARSRLERLRREGPMALEAQDELAG